MRSSVFISAVLGAATPARADEPLSVDAAVTEALAHNVRLDVDVTDAAIARARVQEVRGQRWPTLGLEGDVHGGYPSHYASGDARLQLVAAVPIVDPALGAELRAAALGPTAADAAVEIGRIELTVEVRSAFAELLARTTELALHDEGLDRLRDYLDLVTVRQRGGDPVAGDLLRAKVRLRQAEADRADAERSRSGAEIELDGLLGRPLGTPLVLAPSNDLKLDVPIAGGPADTAELRQADAAVQIAEAERDVQRAARRPTLVATGNVGAEPVLGSSFEAPANTGRGIGAEGLIELSVPLWDHSVVHARIAQAELGATRSEQARAAAIRDVDIAWHHAHDDVERLTDELETRRDLAPAALDAYLYAASLYRGGAGSGLDVLDAFDAWNEASLGLSETTLAFRQASAQLDRWEGR